jgi:hypothetical protein
MKFDGSRVRLPRAARAPFQVFVNGVPQKEGEDYRVAGEELEFNRRLQSDKVGFWRWTLMFFNIAGTYGGQTVDVRYAVGGRDTVATGLEILPPKASA